MPAYIDQSFELFQNKIHITNLPGDVTANQVNNLFGQFGIIRKLDINRRNSKNSSLANPIVTLIFERRETVDIIMSKRPYFLNDYQLCVRRCLPITRRYPYETQVTTNKILVRIPQENHEEILPHENIIRDYLKVAGGEILRLGRLDDKTVLIEFDDYDTVDVCCLSRPHFINDQLIEIEKCADEQQARRRVQFRQKARPLPLKPSPIQTTVDNDTQSHSFISPTLTLNFDEQIAQLRLIYDDKTNQLEHEHEQLISSLKAQWEQMTKERIRLQRLAYDHQQAHQRLTEENRQWKRSYDESIQEKSRTQNDADRVLLDASEIYSTIKKNYDQLTKDIYQQTL